MSDAVATEPVAADAATQEGTSETAVAEKASKPKSKAAKPKAPAAAKPPKATEGVNPNAVKDAVSTGIAQQSGMIMTVPLSSITKSENPRQEPSKLASQGYFLINDEDKTKSLLDMCLAEDQETLQAVVGLFEEHEGEDVFDDEEDSKEPHADLSGIKHKEGPTKYSIVSLARSLQQHQVSPVSVRRGGQRKDGGYNYTLIFGQRRTAAVAYAYAKSKLDKLEGNKNSQFKNFQPVIQAVEIKCSEEEAFELAVAENMNRKDFTPVQEGMIYSAFLKRQNPETGKKWNLKDVTKHLYPQEPRSKYGHVRNRYALVMPYKADEVDDKGNLVKAGRGLTAEERAGLENGEKTLTWAIRRALREEHYSDEGTPQKNRRKALPLKQIEELFDNTAESNVERRKALAECMSATLKQATKESEKRIQAAEEKEANKANKAKGKKGQAAEETAEAAAE